MRDLLVATTNPGKIREILSVLAGVPTLLKTLADLPPIPEPEETGATFAENAALKAHYYATRTGLPTVAEDSGLTIDALGHRPGIHSARYPGDTYEDKFKNLYAELAGHPQPWKASFVCSLAVVQGSKGPGVQLFACEAVIDGEISSTPRGTNGFGYDPIFYYPGFGKTFGEASNAEKLSVAHRARAFQKLRREFLTRVSSPRRGPGATTRR